MPIKDSPILGIIFTNLNCILWQKINIILNKCDLCNKRFDLTADCDIELKVTQYILKIKFLFLRRKLYTKQSNIMFVKRKKCI